MSKLMGATSQARHAANRELISRHWSEWEQIHSEERLKRGLSARVIPKELEFLRNRVAELEALVGSKS